MLQIGPGTSKQIPLEQVGRSEIVKRCTAGAIDLARLRARRAGRSAIRGSTRPRRHSNTARTTTSWPTPAPNGAVRRSSRSPAAPRADDPGSLVDSDELRINGPGRPEPGGATSSPDSRSTGASARSAARPRRWLISAPPPRHLLDRGLKQLIYDLAAPTSARVRTSSSASRCAPSPASVSKSNADHADLRRDSGTGPSPLSSIQAACRPELAGRDPAAAAARRPASQIIVQDR